MRKGTPLGDRERERPATSRSGAERMQVVRAFADNVLEKGRDRWSGKDTPLLADGVNVQTGEPVEWLVEDERWIVSNLASQQNLFRTLTGLGRLTGEPKYRAAAEAATRYHLDNLRRDCGLLAWGGHRFIELRTLAVVGEQNKHEFKCSYPYYDLLWELDRNAAERFIKAFWNAHVLDWYTLDMNRHGSYNLAMGKLWDSDFEQQPSFFEGNGLTFINCGSDLIYAAGMLHTYTGDEGALTWSRRLAEQYVRARDPNTGLGAYQFSQVKAKRKPGADRSTRSAYGDRAKRQFGPEFRERALEGRVLDPGRATTIYGRATIAQLRLAERLGDKGAEFLQWAHSGLAAYARHAYDPETNLLTAMFTDGTKITPEDAKKRRGYYKPEIFRPQPAPAMLFLSYALGYRLGGEELLWDTARSIAKAYGLGDLGTRPGHGVQPNLQTTCHDPQALFGLLEIMSVSEHQGYLDLALRIGHNIVATRFRHGLFLPSEDHVNACFDSTEPLALLALDARLRGTPEAVPAYPGGRGYIHGPYEGMGRTYDSSALWARSRADEPHRVREE